MGNAIQNSIFRVMKETQENVQGRPQMPTTTCPRCGATMFLNPTQDMRVGIFICSRCRNRIHTRLQ